MNKRLTSSQEGETKVRKPDVTEFEMTLKLDNTPRTNDIEVVDVDGAQLATGSRSSCWAMLATCVAMELQPEKPTRLTA